MVRRHRGLRHRRRTRCGVRSPGAPHRRRPSRGPFDKLRGRVRRNVRGALVRVRGRRRIRVVRGPVRVAAVRAARRRARRDPARARIRRERKRSRVRRPARRCRRPPRHRDGGNRAAHGRRRRERRRVRDRSGRRQRRRRRHGGVRSGVRRRRRRMHDRRVARRARRHDRHANASREGSHARARAGRGDDCGSGRCGIAGASRAGRRRRARGCIARAADREHGARAAGRRVHVCGRTAVGAAIPPGHRGRGDRAPRRDLGRQQHRRELRRHRRPADVLVRAPRVCRRISCVLPPRRRAANRDRRERAHVRGTDRPHRRPHDVRPRRLVPHAGAAARLSSEPPLDGRDDGRARSAALPSSPTPSRAGAGADRCRTP